MALNKFAGTCIKNKGYIHNIHIIMAQVLTNLEAISTKINDQSILYHSVFPQFCMESLNKNR